MYLDSTLLVYHHRHRGQLSGLLRGIRASLIACHCGLTFLSLVQFVAVHRLMFSSDWSLASLAIKKTCAQAFLNPGPVGTVRGKHYKHSVIVPSRPPKMR